MFPGSLIPADFRQLLFIIPAKNASTIVIGEKMFYSNYISTYATPSFQTIYIQIHVIVKKM